MENFVRKLTANAPRPMLSPAMALRKVTSKSGKGVYASTDTLFKGAVFGRDSIEVAEDILTIRPKLVRRIILTLAGLQGEVSNDLNEEEPGKIIHEYRQTVVDGKAIKGMQRHIFDELGSRWGGTDDTLAYYGSIDATPHFIRLVSKYVGLYGSTILDEQVLLRSGAEIPVHEVLHRAAGWLGD